MTSTQDTAAARIGEAIRSEFPIFETTTYLNSCSQGALSHRVREAVEGWLAGWDANGAEWEFWVERSEAFRSAVAGLLHAEADDVAVTTSVSQGVSGLVSALALDGERNRIVVSEYEFPTVGQIAHAQELRGAEVVHVVPDRDGSIPPSGSSRRSTSGPRSCAARRSRTARDTATTWRRSPRRRTPPARSSSPTATRPAERSRSTSGRSGPTSSRVGRSSTSWGARASASCGSGPSCGRRCSRPRRDGSPTKTSLRCRSPTTRPTRARAASMPARRRCLRSTRASRASHSSRRRVSLRSRSTWAGSPSVSSRGSTCSGRMW